MSSAAEITVTRALMTHESEAQAESLYQAHDKKDSKPS